jgi:large subunit ribosomal protein L21
MSYAVIRINHRQFQVSPGDSIIVTGTFGEVGQSLNLGEILLLNDQEIEVGTPTIKGGVTLSVKNHQKSPKITVKTFKAKSRYRRTKGHRQPQTVFEVVAVGPLGLPKPKKAPKSPKTATLKTTPAKKPSTSVNAQK